MKYNQYPFVSGDFRIAVRTWKSETHISLRYLSNDPRSVIFHFFRISSGKSCNNLSHASCVSSPPRITNAEIALTIRDVGSHVSGGDDISSRDDARYSGFSMRIIVSLFDENHKITLSKFFYCLQTLTLIIDEGELIFYEYSYWRIHDYQWDSS